MVQLLRFVSDSDARGFVLTVFKHATQTPHPQPSNHTQAAKTTRQFSPSENHLLHPLVFDQSQTLSFFSAAMWETICRLFQAKNLQKGWGGVKYSLWSPIKGKHTQPHAQTWPASLVDSTQQLDAALVAPVVEDPGQDVEVSLRQRVFEEIPWKIHTQFKQCHGLCNTHQLGN